MVFTLMFASPLALLAALIVAAVGHMSGAIPRGMTFSVSTFMLTFAIMGGLATVLTYRLMISGGARAQERMLGGQYAGLLQLRDYRDSEIPDPGQDWRYRLDPETAALLRRRCRTFRPPDECTLYRGSDARSVRSAVLIGNDLFVQQWQP